MTRLLVALTISTMLAVPALAADMPCSDFMAMDAAGQMAAMEDAMSADGAMAEGAMADGEMAEGAMAEGEMADGAMAEGEMADGAMADGEMAEDGMAAEGGMDAMVAACTAHPDMSVMEAMGAMQ